MKPLAEIVIGTLRKSGLMRIPTRMGNTSWTTYWFLIMLEEKPPWYEATTWAVITGLLTQIFVRSIKTYGALPNAWNFHRKDRIREQRRQN